VGVTSPAIAELRRLLRFGFRREPILGADGELEVVIFVRDWKGWREVVLVYSEREARAYRTRIDVASDNPLYVPPGTAEVQLPLDDVVTTVHALLSLPSSPPCPPPHSNHPHQDDF
jgi:hypothetical protein